MALNDRTCSEHSLFVWILRARDVLLESKVCESTCFRKRHLYQPLLLMRGSKRSPAKRPVIWACADIHHTDEIQTLRANLKQARQDHQALESQLRELRSMETAAKFKVDSLSQQLNLLQEHA